MIRNDNIVTASVGELPVGSLIAIKVHRTDETSLAVVLDQDGGSATLGGLEQIHESMPGPAFMRITKDARCVSYGLDWVAEPLVDRSVVAGDKRFSDYAGALLIDAGELLVQFPPIKELNQMDLTFNLSENQLIGELSNAVAVCRRWNVWADLNHYEKRFSGPLLEVHAVEIDPTA